MSNAKIFSYKIQKEGEWSRILLGGPITEFAKSQLERLCSEAGAKCILDLGAVTFVNSCGIRDWSHFLKVLKKNRDLEFDFVPDEIVRTMNMMIVFRQDLPIRSVIRMYECEKCQSESSVLLSNGKDFQVNQVPKIAPVKCASCGSLCQPFESDEDFFMFLMPAA